MRGMKRWAKNVAFVVLAQIVLFGAIYLLTRLGVFVPDNGEGIP